MNEQVFISYKAEDRIKAEQVKDVIEQNGYSCWMAPESIPGGSSYAKEIEGAIKHCKALVIIFSKAAMNSKWVEKELDRAINQNKLILPLRIEEFELNEAFSFYLTNVQFYDAFNNNIFSALSRLIKELNKHFKPDMPFVIYNDDKPNNSSQDKKKNTPHFSLKTIIAVGFIVFLSSLIAVITFIISSSKPEIEFDNDFVESNHNTNQIITFGSYPQSRVKDYSLINALNSLDLKWTSLNYYAGNESFDGKMQPYNIAFFSDVTYQGNKYRALRLEEYRPTLTSAKRVKDYPKDSTNQYDNGYQTDVVYWFKFEPISWTVLDEDEGLLLSNYILDAQPYVNVIYKGSDNNYYTNGNEFSNSWDSSYLRYWLNNDFYNTAFSDKETRRIKTTINQNDYINGTDYGYQHKTSTEKVFILSYNDLISASYGFNSDPSYSDSFRAAVGTDYAESQNLDVFEIESESDKLYSQYVGYAYYGIRTEGKSTRNICYTDARGFILNYDYTNDTSCGIRPALKVSK